MITQNYECWICDGREYHCIMYVEALSCGLIHKLGELCPIFQMQRDKLFERECKRLGLETEFILFPNNEEEVW